MRTLRTLIATLTLAALVAGAAWAHSVTYETSSGPLFSFSMQEGWGFRINGDRLVAAPADGSMWFGAWEMKREDVPDQALDEVEGYLDAYFQDVALKPAADTSINGMKARRIDGTGTYESNPIRFTVVLFEPRPKAVCVAVGVWDDEGKEKAGPVQATLESLRPTPGG